MWLFDEELDREIQLDKKRQYVTAPRRGEEPPSNLRAEVFALVLPKEKARSEFTAELQFATIRLNGRSRSELMDFLINMKLSLLRAR